MHHKQISLPAAAVTLVLLGGVDAFWRMNCDVIQTGRVDPIVNPGTVAAHCHTIVGGNNVGVNSTYGTLLQSSCNSCEIMADKGAYWTPNLYYEHGNGSFEEITHSGSVIYYIGRGFRPDGQQIYTAFPKGFKMVTGNKAIRAYNGSGMTWGNASWPNVPITDAASFVCLQEDGAPQYDSMLNMSTCVNGWRAQIHFQTCWNGVDLYKSDNSHVAHLSSIDNGICPPNYPHLLPHIFMETNYAVNQIADQSDGGRFVFSQGDPTGYGFHGDFLNAWQTSVLQLAINSCLADVGFGTIEECPILNSVRQEQFGTNCPAQPDQIAELVHGLIAKLPGCINITPGPGSATSADMECAAGIAQPAITKTVDTKPTATANPAIGSVYGKKFSLYLGCGNDSVGALLRTLNAAYTTIPNMTVEYCQSYCTSLGYRYSGLEYANECYCDLAINPSAEFYAGLNLVTGCDMQCPGNSVEMCGGPQFMNVYNNTDPSFVPTNNTVGSAYQLTVPVAPFTANYIGCVTEGTSGRALNATSTQSANMTIETCAAFCADYAFYGLEYATQCFCGDGLASGSAVVDSSQDPLVSSCQMRCTGNYSQICGQGNILSVYSNPSYQPTVVVAAANGYNSKACLTDPGNGGLRALQGAYTTDPSMTVEMCTSYCKARQFKYAGLEYGTQCFCDSQVRTASGAVAEKCPYGGTLMWCGGNKYEYCGAGDLLNLYYYSGGF